MNLSLRTFCERPGAGEFDRVSGSLGRTLTLKDVPDVSDGKTAGCIDSSFSIIVTLDPVGSEHEIDVERPILDLHKVLASNDLSFQGGIYFET